MDSAAYLLAFISSFAIVFITMPPLMRKMREGGMVGQDVNKKGRPYVPELGGIAALFAFSISLSLVVGLFLELGRPADSAPSPEPPYLAAISVFFIASMVGLIDDISNIKQRVKAAAVIFAALPLMLVHLGDAVIQFPFGFVLDFQSSYTLYLLYWLILVPIGVTGFANAMNMSAGYNGLESGQVTIVSVALFLIGIIKGVPDVSLVVFVAITGCAFGIFLYNRHPAKVFVGDIGTLGLGAAIAAGVIMGHIEFYAIIAIAPAFYEAFATAYFVFVKREQRRRELCHNPVINEDGTLAPPKGAERFTLAYFILSKKPITERRLVATILSLYVVSCAVAVVLSVL